MAQRILGRAPGLRLGRCVSAAVCALLLQAGAARARVIYVDVDNVGPKDGNSWATAYDIVQEAAWDAVFGDEIWVAEGAYDNGGSVSDPVLGMTGGVAVYGGFGGWETSRDERDWKLHVTVLDGLNIAYSVVIGVNDATLDGFTVTGGTTGPGGGMWNAFVTNLTVANCTFTGNSASQWGGGMGNFQSSPTVTNCRFTNNTAGEDGGGMYNNDWSSPTVTNCTFSANRATGALGRGGGMFNWQDSSPTVANCVFIGNTTYDGGGMRNEMNCFPIVENCLFLDNSTSDDGAGMTNYDNSNPTVANCVFSGNRASSCGGGMENYNSGAIVTNCTFSGNSASQRGGAIHNNQSWDVVFFTNCIIWGNASPVNPAIDDEDGNCIVDFCDIEGGYPGGSWIDQDPLFVDADGADDTYGTKDDDVRLRPGSPCIDAADSGAQGYQPTDADGLPRFDDPATEPNSGAGTPNYADMGAYEFCHSLSIDDVKALEGDSGTTTFTFTVTLSVAQGTDVTFDWATSDGSAVAGTDYVAASGTGETITAGGTSTTIDITVNGDTDKEPTETFFVTISNPSPGIVIRDGGGVGTIKGDDMTVWYVDSSAPAGGDGTSWDTAFQHPQEAIDAASANSLHAVWVAYGGYPGPIVMKDGVSMYGGFRWDETELSQRDWQSNPAWLDGQYSAYHVVVAASNAALDGFTVSGGSAYGSDPDDRGAGMIVTDAENVAIRHCVFADNQASYVGGALRIVGSSVSVHDCLFIQNSGDQYGGAISNGDGSTVTYTDCVFEGNFCNNGGGAMNSIGCTVSITDCHFEFNMASNGYGGALRDTTNAQTTVAGCVFFENYGYERGGAACCTSSATSVYRNCTFAVNSAGNGSSFYVSNSANLTVTNCILWNQAGQEIYQAGGSVTVEFSDVQSGWGGPGNISDDPAFVDYWSGDLRLTGSSPCIDAADGTRAPEFDKDGYPRVDHNSDGGPGVGPPWADMGAYEYLATPPTLSIDDVAQDEGDAGETTFAFTITLSMAMGVDVLVDWTTSDGWAKSGTDYLAAAGTAAVPAGSTSTTVEIAVNGDTAYEIDEDFYVELSNPSRGQIGDGQGKATIVNDDPMPTVDFAADQDVGESAGTVTVTATLSSASGLDVMVPFTVGGTATSGGTDHDASDSIIFIMPGNTKESYTFNVVDDMLDENNETVVFTMDPPSNAVAGVATHTVTILDNDPTPTVSFETNQTVNENAGTVAVKATLSAVGGLDVTVPFTVGGTAQSPDDHDATSGSLSIPAGSASSTYQFSVVEDALDEANETVVFSMGTPTNATPGATTTHTVTITDNDPVPAVNFATDQSVNESVGVATVTATLSALSGRKVTVPFTVGGSATGGGVDHDAADGSVVIDAGAWDGTYQFNVVDDALDEAPEKIEFTMGTPTNANPGTTTSHVVTIQDNDPPPTVDFAVGQTVSEGVGTVTVTATLDAASGLQVTVPFAVGGTASNPEDHGAVAGSVTIGPGAPSGTYQFNVVDDLLDENSETVVITMGAPVNATAGISPHTVTITDNDATPTVSFETGQSVNENVVTVTVKATLSAASGFEVTVPFTVGGTAVSPADHNAANGSIAIPAGDPDGTYQFSVVDDGLDEGDETVVFTMGAPTNATPGAPTTHAVTITDNDPLPTVNFAADQPVDESVGTVTVTATLSAASGRQVTVPFTVLGTAGNPDDHNAAANSITIAPGALNDTYQFDVVNDVLDEDDETVVFTMGAPTNAAPGATTTHTVTIQDNDATPTVDLAASQAVPENVGAVTVTATLDAASGLQVTVPFTVGGTATGGGTDHDAADGSIVIPAGSISEDYTFNVTNDVLDEGDETVVFTMGAPTNATAGVSVHTVTIGDNDAAPTVSFETDQTVNENAGAVIARATLSAPSGLDVTVPFAVSGTAVNPADHNAAGGSIVIAAGSPDGTYQFDVAEDALDEDDETIIFTMGAPTNASPAAPTTHTVTITDNDPLPTVNFAADQPANEIVGTVTVAATLSASSGREATVPFTVAGTATGGGTDHDAADNSIVIAAGQLNGTYQFNVADDSLDEDDETVVFTMGAPTNATPGAATTHTVTIQDNDAAPTVDLAADQNVDESAGTVTVTATLNATSGLDVTVPFTVGGTATGGGTDHNAANNSIAIAAGQLNGSYQFSVTEDALDEDDETVVFTMGAPTNATAGVSTHTVTIGDNDPLPTVQWTMGSQSAAESAGTVTVTAQLSEASGRTVAIPFSVGGDATGGGTDYNDPVSPVTITAGQLTGTVSVTIVDDGSFEVAETVILTIGAPTNATASGTTEHTITITDNDGSGPTINWTVISQSVGESVGTVTVTAILEGVPAADDIVVQYTAGGTAGNPADHDAVAGSVSFGTGDPVGTTRNVTFSVVNDGLDEGDETVVLSLTSVTAGTANLGAQVVHTVTIGDDDPAPTADFAGGQNVDEGVGTVTVTATLSAASGLDVTVPFTLSGTATNPDDHNAADGSIAITAGQISGTYQFTVAEDGLDEDDETVVFTMGAPTNATAGVSTHTATVQDNDAMPTVDLASGQSVNEAAGTVTVTATLSVASGRDVTVPFSVGGTAVNPDDHDAADGSIAITIGQMSGTYQFSVVEDTLDEDDETVVFTMGAPTNATAGVSTHTVTITDNDAPPTVDFALDQSVNEMVGTVTVTATLSAASGLDVTVPFTLSGTAGNPDDHDAANGNLTVTAGQTSGTYQFAVVEDTLDEDDETVVFTLGTPTNADQGTTTTHTVTILDNDATPTVDFALDQSVNETVGTVTVTATLSAASGLDVTVPFTLGGTATNPDDHSAADGSITIAAGQLSDTCQFTVVDDALDEDDETVVFTMGAPVNAGQGTTTTHTVTIQDNDAPPTLDFAADQPVNESVGTVTVTATLSAASGRDVTVPFTLSGTAGNPDDHDAVNGNVTVTAGQMSGTYQFAVVEDALDEDDETIIFTMGAPTNATAGVSTHTVTITDNDAAPTVSFGVDQNVDESVGAVTVTATLGAESGLEVTVPFAVTGTSVSPGDHDASSGSITIAAGQMSGTYQFNVVDDALDEDDETAVFTMGSPVNADQGATTTHTVTIADNDAVPTVDLAIDQNVGEAVGTVTVTATLNAASGLDVTVPFSVSGTAASPDDHGALDGNIVITAGQMGGTYEFAVVDDALDEDDETVVFTMGAPVNAGQGTTTAHAVTIQDNDAAPTVDLATDQSVNEAAGTVTVTATLSAASGLDVTVPFTASGTATNPDDHDAADGSISITAGQLSGSFQFSVVNDLLDEDNETVVFTMGAPANATAGTTTVHTATILDNDATPTADFAIDQSVNEMVGAVTVTAALNAASGRDVAVPFTVGGTAGNPDDHDAANASISITAGQLNGSYQFSVVDDLLDEDDETAVFTMGTPINADQGTTTTHTVTILDNDVTPTVDLALDQSVNEMVGTVTVTATLNAVSGRTVAVPFTVGGTASGGGVDHNAADASITIAAGNPTGSHTFNVVDDALDENDETAVFTMGAPTNATAGATTTHTVTITDNDAAPTVDFALDQSVNEMAGTVTVTATLSAVSGLDVTVPFTVSGTATGGGADHDASGGSIVIPAGSPDGTYQFSLTDDALDENDETVIFTMGAPVNAVAGASTHTVTISDNDAPPTVNFSLDQNVAEMAGTVTVTAALDAVSGLQVTVPFSVVGTAANPDDHNAADGNLTIPAGTLSADYQFDVVDDALDESDETVILAMGAPTNATKGNGTHTVTIADDDAPPTVEWTTASQSAAESIGTVTITAQLSAESGLDVTVPFTLGGGADGGGVDYDDPVSPLTIAAGETTAALTITIIDDAEVELSETIMLTMSSPTNATLGATTDHTVTISDNDGTGPTINWTVAAQSVGENVGVVTVTAVLGDEMATDDITVEYAVGGTAGAADHDAVAGTVNFTTGDPAGTTKDVTFNVTADILDEDDETVVLSLTSVTIGTAKLGTTVVHTATIADDDPLPAVDFAADQNVGEDAGTVTVTVTLAAASGRDVTVPFTVGGTAEGASDHNASNGSIVIAAGELSGTYSFSVTDDLLDEADETVVFTMGTPTNATQGTTTAHTLTIADNDSPPTVNLAASQSVSETAGTATLTATLDVASGLEVTVPFTVSGTAANPDDHDAANGSITIAAGELTGTYQFDVVDDALDEDDEAIIFTMTTGSVTNAQAGETTSHTVTITDDDVAPAVDFAVGQDVLEDVGTVTVTATLDAASGLDVTVPFTVGGTATGGGTDHSALSGEVVISRGNTSGSYTFDVVDDALDEEDETVVFTMGTPTNATQGTTTLHTVTIMDDDAPPTVEWTTASQLASESVGTVTVTAQLSAASGLDVTVPFTPGGTATGGGVDYNDPVSPITITAGELSNSVSITIMDDLDDESVGPNETVVLTMGAPTNATQGAMGVHTVEIIDNDAADVPTVEWAVASQLVGEGVGTVTVTATLDMPAAEAIDVAYTVGGSAANPADHDAADGTVSFAVDDTSAVVSIAIADDLTDENSETIVLTMTEVTSGSANLGTTVVHTVTITDNDPAPTVVFAADQNVDEGVGTATVTATLDVASGLDVTVPFTVSGTATNPDDHDAVMGSITIGAGGLSGSYAFSLQDDELVEESETILFLMGAPTNAIAGLPSVHVVTITDNDTTPTVQWLTDSEAVSEGDGTVTVTATLSRAAPENIVVVYTVAGTAANPEDHNAANGTVSFDVGVSTDDIVVILNDDSLEEGVETIVLTLAFVTTGDADFGPPNVQTVTIVDNDGAGSLTVVATSPSDGATDVALSTSVRVTFSEPMNQAVTAGAFSLEGGAGAVTGTFSWDAAGEELSFTPAEALEEGTTYTATIGATATSDSGVPLGEDYVFTFTTAEQWGGIFRGGCASALPADRSPFAGAGAGTSLLLFGLAFAVLRRRGCDSLR